MLREMVVKTTEDCWNNKSCNIIHTIITQIQLQDTPGTSVILSDEEKKQKVDAWFRKQKQNKIYIEDEFIAGFLNQEYPKENIIICISTRSNNSGILWVQSFI